MNIADDSADVLPLIRSDGTRLTLREVEASAIDHAINTCRSVSEVARELGIGRSTLYRKVRQLYGGHAPRCFEVDPSFIASAPSAHRQG